MFSSYSKHARVFTFDTHGCPGSSDAVNVSYFMNQMSAMVDFVMELDSNTVKKTDNTMMASFADDREQLESRITELENRITLLEGKKTSN